MGKGCARKVFFGIGSNGNWSYLLPRRLAPGRYVLDVKAFDRARNRDERFVRGTNRVVFYVGRGYGAPAAAAHPGAGGRAVRVLLAGKSESSAAVVRARATHVQVGGRKCKVGASTPLAALAALLRAHRHDVPDPRLRELLAHRRRGGRAAVRAARRARTPTRAPTAGSTS